MKTCIGKLSFGVGQNNTPKINTIKFWKNIKKQQSKKQKKEIKGRENYFLEITSGAQELLCMTGDTTLLWTHSGVFSLLMKYI